MDITGFLKRASTVLGVESGAELGRLLGVTRQAVGGRKRKGTANFARIFDLLLERKEDIDLHWVLVGQHSPEFYKMEEAIERLMKENTWLKEHCKYISQGAKQHLQDDTNVVPNGTMPKAADQK